MAGTVLVGYDGSPGAADALVLGIRIAAAARRPLELVAVRPPRIPRSIAGADAEDERLWERAHAPLREAPLSIEVERHVVCADSVAQGLQAFAERERAAALVVGCPERAGSGHIETGTVAQRLLHGSPCAVALAPRAYAEIAPEPFARIVVGYTDSDEARAAVRVAAGIGEACNATVRVVSVVGKVPSWSAGLAGYADAIRAEVQRNLDEVLRRLASGVATEGVVADGNPAERVLEQAHGWADLIVSGSRGYGPKRQVLLGSVSAGLLDNATVPVIVTPRGADVELIAAAGPAPTAANA